MKHYAHDPEQANCDDEKWKHADIKEYDDGDDQGDVVLVIRKGYDEGSADKSYW